MFNLPSSTVIKKGNRGIQKDHPDIRHASTRQQSVFVEWPSSNCRLNEPLGRSFAVDRRSEEKRGTILRGPVRKIEARRPVEISITPTERSTRYLKRSVIRARVLEIKGAENHATGRLYARYESHNYTEITVPLSVHD